MRSAPASVSVCLTERIIIAGMAHILLPHQEDAIDRQNPYKFADRGCEELLRAMTACGAGREYITAKLAGGARNVYDLQHFRRNRSP